MAMGLVAVTEADWFDIDDRYPMEIAERQRLMAERHSDVFGMEPGSGAACAEALTMLIEHLTRVYPGWFACDDAVLHNRLTGEHWDLAADQPLALAGRLVQEDLCPDRRLPRGTTG